MAEHGHGSTVLEQSPTPFYQGNHGYRALPSSTALLYALNRISTPILKMNMMRLSIQEAEMKMNLKLTFLMTLPHLKAVLTFTNARIFDPSMVNPVPNQLNDTEKLIKE
jgi:hypothetical protein